VHFKNNAAVYMYGFVLMAKGAMFEFYFKEDKNERDEWVNQLKKSVILLDVKEDLEFGELLGRGNFAKVHLCTRKGQKNGTKYALKTIEKSMINQSVRNRVSY
jgi:hypothetical protein